MYASVSPSTKVMQGANETIAQRNARVNESRRRELALFDRLRLVEWIEFEIVIGLTIVATVDEP